MPFQCMEQFEYYLDLYDFKDKFRNLKNLFWKFMDVDDTPVQI